VVAIALGALLLGEHPSLISLLGGAVVLVSVVLLLSSRARQAP
jgi:drug/metabolite transporter (DMT)-like permease